MSGTSRMHQFERAFRVLVQIMGFNADLAALPEAVATTQAMTGLEDAKFRKMRNLIRSNGPGDSPGRTGLEAMSREWIKMHDLVFH